MKSIIVHFSTFSKALIFALLGLMVFQPDPAIAKIYKYKDEHGKTHFTDDPSSIPLRYRNKDSLRKFREVGEPAPESKESSSLASIEKSKGEADGILSAQEIGLIRRTMQVFKVGMALGDRYKETMPTFANGQGAVNAIQSALPMKEGLAAELEGTKVPELQGALGFLKQSISADQQAASIGAGLKRRIASIFARLVDEGKQQAGLIEKLEKALENSEKKKKEAKKKKEEEATKESEENSEETEEAKKKKEEEARKKEEDARKKEEETKKRIEAAKKKAEEAKKQAAEDFKKALAE